MDDNPPVSSPISEIACEAELVAPRHEEKGPVDRGTLLLTYLSFLGDAEKTAAALHTTVVYVRREAVAGGWESQVQRFVALKQEQGTDALAKELNRTVNYVQAVKLRNLLDRVIQRITDEKLSFDDFVSARGKDKDNFSAKGAVDLVKAVETVHKMTYQALGDSLGERVTSEKDEGAKNVSLSVLRALAATTGTTLAGTSILTASTVGALPAPKPAAAT